MAKQPTGAHIVGFRAENFKRIQVVEIKPTGNMVVLSGRNRQGKTSILDAIAAAIEGKAAIQKQPVRRGEKKAWIEIDLSSGMKVKRSFITQDDGTFTTSISVIAADGGKMDKPQMVLDSLYGELSFDPIGFARMTPEEQFAELRKFVPDVDFDKIERLNNTNYDARTEASRDAKRLRMQADGISIPETAPAERVDEQQLIAEMMHASQHNTDVEKEKLDRVNTQRTVDSYTQGADAARANAARLRAEAEAHDKEAARLDASASKIAAELAKLPAVADPINVADLRTKIEQAQANNRIFDRIEQRNNLIADAEIAEARAKDMTGRIEARKQAMQAAIAKAKMPIDGLGFGDNYITLNGVPFEQASDGEQLQASIAIAGALNPELRVIRVRDGNHLDEDARAMLAKHAEANNLQVWMELVSSGDVGIVIEDGLVKAQPATEAAE
jgi:hypothetical protein